ncbi:unnamed protein product [Agarophyton chilense]
MFRVTSNLRGLATHVVRSARNCSTAAEAVPASAARRPKRRAPAALEVTPAAAERIRFLMSQKTPKPAGVRIGLRTRGCNGMAYTLNYADERSKFDEKVSIEGGEVYIDPLALMHIVGTRMDFIDNDLVSEFVFHNPNAKGTCGCGESFNV